MLEGARALDGVAGFVEAPRFYPYLSGRKNLELGAALDGGDAPERIDDALETVDLAKRAHDKVRGYSHGMKQRLGIAGALLRDPRLLLLDEPTTGLDPAGMRDMRALVHRLAEDGLTVLLSSHLMGEVEDLCDRVAIVTRGRVVYEGALDELIASTAGRYDLRTTDDGPAAVIARRAHGIFDVTASSRGIDVRGRRARRRRADARAGAGRHRAARARAADGDAGGAVLPDDRGSRRMSAARRPTWPVARERRRGPHVAAPRRRHRLRVGAAQAAAQKRTYIGLRLRAAGPADLHRLAAGRRRRAGGDPVRRLRARVRPRDPARRPVLRRVLVLPAGHGAGRGRHRRHRGRQRDAEDDPHPLGRPLADLRRARCSPRSPTRSPRWSLFVGVGLVLGGLIWGFDPLISLSGSEISVGRSLLLIGGAALAYFLPTMAVASLAILLSTVTRNSAAAVVATLMLSLIMQLLGIVSALDFLRPVPAAGAVQRLAGPAARADRLGAGGPRRVGLSALFAIPAPGVGVHALPAARRRRG